MEKELCNLKRQKATGIDSLPTDLLKDCAVYLSTLQCCIINLFISASTIPTIGKHAKVSPVFKSGDSLGHSNYRAISILLALSKILEKLIHKQLMDYLKTENLLYNKQYKFHRKWSTKMAGTLLFHRICQQIDSGKLIEAI